MDFKLESGHAGWQCRIFVGINWIELHRFENIGWNKLGLAPRCPIHPSPRDQTLPAAALPASLPPSGPSPAPAAPAAPPAASPPPSPPPRPSSPVDPRPGPRHESRSPQGHLATALASVGLTVTAPRLRLTPPPTGTLPKPSLVPRRRRALQAPWSFSWRASPPALRGRGPPRAHLSLPCRGCTAGS